MSKEVQSYVSDSIEVIIGVPADLYIEKILGTTANVGYITSDDGQILVQINNLSNLKMILEADDTYNFKKDEGWDLKRIRITTTSATSLTVRYMFKKAK